MKNLVAQLADEALSHDNLVHVLVVLASLSNQVIDRLASEQALQTLEVVLLPVSLSRQQSRAPHMAIETALSAFEHPLHWNWRLVSPCRRWQVRLLAYLAEGLFVFI